MNGEIKFAPARKRQVDNTVLMTTYSMSRVRLEKSKNARL